MDRLASDAFGKLRRAEGGAISGWHPLVDHLIDVAACFERLCRCRCMHRALERAAGRALSAQDISRLTVLAFLHDLGKANSGFQAKRFAPGVAPADWPRPAGHGIEATRVFADEAFDHLVAKLPVTAMCTWGDAVDPLLKASISHHGRPVIEDASDWPRVIWRPVQTQRGICLYDPALVLEAIGQTATTLFPDAFEPGGESLPEAPRFGHLFAGLIQLADWLGSDARFFRYSQVAEIRLETARANADQAVTALGLDIGQYRERLLASVRTFLDVFGNSPYPVQEALAGDDLGPLVVLESETGSGKTEAALWRFVFLFRLGLVDSLYFALPTRVAATQAHRRIEKAVHSLWPDAPPLVVRALPGYASADGQEPQALPNFEVLWPDRPDDETAHRRWAAESPKRFLAAPIAVGTIDQALLAALQVRHAHLRHALLARSFLVVDEVHASDTYMRVLLERLLDAHLACGGHALLLSATLGSAARSRYLAIGRKDSATAAPPEFVQACAADYPAISDRSRLRKITSTARNKEVMWSAYDAMDDPARIAAMAIEAASAGAKVLVIRNTVPAAIATLAAVEAACPDPSWLFSVAGRATLHHSRFSREDRPLLDDAIEAWLGNQRPSGPAIVIGTQTLEQSLDLDADLLITDLCPMDVLLQRVGRLHRHPRKPNERPAAFRRPQVQVLTPPDHDLSPMLKASRHGLGPLRDGGGVYPDLRIIEATRALIAERPEVSIPADNRYLVEAATHPECLCEIEAQGGASWKHLAQQVEGRTGAERAVGHIHALDFAKEFGTEGFPEHVDIATRLGTQDWLVQFETGLISPFGASLHQLPIRHFLLPSSLDTDTQPTGVSVSAGVTDFTLGTAHFRYSRLGLERLKAE
jgi:CRISPR-associated endonuclease/helicase Cas3